MRRAPSAAAGIDPTMAGEDGALPYSETWIEAGGWSSFVIEAGDEAGAPVLLFHGSSIAVDAQLTWFRAIGPLAASCRRVIAYDQPGFGRSEIPADRRYLDRLQRAEHAQALLDRLAPTDATLVGHSEGGFIATWLALNNPERVRKLVIVASGGTAPRLGDARDQAWMAASSEAYDYIGRSVDEDRFARTEEHLRHREDPPFEALLRRNYREAVRSGNMECFLRMARTRTGYQDYTAMQERCILPFLSKLRVPTLLVWGGRDATVPVARGLALAERIPNSEMHVFPRSGHWVMHEEATAFNRLLDGWI